MATDHIRFNKDVLAKFHLQCQEPRITDWKAFQRPKGGANEHHWRRMFAGEPVPLYFVERCLPYLNEVWIKDDPAEGKSFINSGLYPLSIEQHFEKVESFSSDQDAIEEVRNLRRSGYFWEAGLEFVMALLGRMALTKRFFQTAEPERYPTGPEDYYTMAIQTQRCIAWKKYDKKLPPDKALKIGMEEMGCSPEDLAQFIDRMAAVDPNMTLFYLDRKKGNKPRRIGSEITIPLLKDPYDALKAGELKDLDIKPEHVDTKSGRILLFSMGEEHPGSVWSDVRLSLIQARTTMLQIALFCKPIVQGTANFPSLLMHNAIPEHEKKAKKFGFMPTGQKMKGGVNEFLELRPIHEKDWNETNALSRAAYNTLLHFIERIQSIIGEDKSLIDPKSSI